MSYQIYSDFWSFPKINFTGWIRMMSKKISIRLSQNILSDDQISHSSHKTRIRSCFPSSLFENLSISYVKFRLFMNLTTMWLSWNGLEDLFWPRHFKMKYLLRFKRLEKSNWCSIYNVLDTIIILAMPGRLA